MADKTPPYIPEDYLPLEEETALRSQVVRTNSLFCQSLLREMSENSLILLPKAKSDKDLAKSDYFSSESKENSTPDSLFKLIRRCSGMKTSVSGNMFNDQIEKISSNVPSDISSKETSNKTAPELPMERFCSTNRDISAKEVEVLSSQVPSKEFSLKRSRNLSGEGESEDSFEKRARVSAEEIGTGEQGKEMFLISRYVTITQDMPPEAPSEGTMTETNVECGVSPNENKSEGQVAEEEEEKSDANMTSEESMDVPSVESGKMSQSSSVPDQQQVSIAVDKEKSSEGDRFNLWKRNCPSDPKLRSKITTTSEKSTDVTTAEAEKSTDVTTVLSTAEAEKMSQSSINSRCQLLLLKKKLLKATGVRFVGKEIVLQILNCVRK
nr:uncharacterized protein LOC113804365 [Penaeus vannamei]